MNYLRLIVYNFFKSFRRLIRASPPGARATLTIGSFLFNHYVRHAALAWIENARIHRRRSRTPCAAQLYSTFVSSGKREFSHNSRYSGCNESVGWCSAHPSLLVTAGGVVCVWV